MNPLEIVLSVWVLVLTLVVVLLARQLSILSFRIIKDDKNNSFDFSQDGPELGTELSPTWLASLDLERGGTLVVMSATCESCRQVVDGLHGLGRVPHLVALLSGAGEIADSMAARLSTVDGVTVVRERTAERFAEEFGIKSVPFALTVQGGRIQSKGFVYNASVFVGAVRGELDVVAKSP